MRELVKSGVHEYQFWGAHESHQGIEVFTGDDLVQIHPVEFRSDEKSAKIDIGACRPAVCNKNADTMVNIGNQNTKGNY